MAMSPEDHKRTRYRGRTMVAQHLITMCEGGGLSHEGSESYANGVLEGVRDFLTAYHSPQAAYDGLQSVADGTAQPLLRGVETPL